MITLPSGYMERGEDHLLVFLTQVPLPFHVFLWGLLLPTPEVCMGPAPSPGFRGWHVSQLDTEMPRLGFLQQPRGKRHSLFMGVARLMGLLVTTPVLHLRTKPTKRSQEVEKVCCPDISKPLDPAMPEANHISGLV